jgi:hypothetical protein
MGQQLSPDIGTGNAHRSAGELFRLYETQYGHLVVGAGYALFTGADGRIMHKIDAARSAIRICTESTRLD